MDERAFCTDVSLVCPDWELRRGTQIFSGCAL